MGQGLSCNSDKERGLFTAIQSGDLDVVRAILETNPALIHHATAYDCNSALHVSAANGQIEVGIFLN